MERLQQAGKVGRDKLCLQNRERRALYENWEGGSGIKGKSINYFDPQKEKWVQVWVDGSGGVIRIEGNYSDGKMILEGKHVLKDGSEEMFRGTWFKNEEGTVRQFFEFVLLF